MSEPPKYLDISLKPPQPPPFSGQAKVSDLTPRDKISMLDGVWGESEEDRRSGTTTRYPWMYSIDFHQSNSDLCELHWLDFCCESINAKTTTNDEELIPTLNISESTVFPINARITIGSRIIDCSGEIADYYEIKEFAEIK